MKTAVYKRAKQNASEESFSDQKEKILDFCAKHGVEVCTEHEEMSALDILKKDMKDGKVETVITTKENENI